MTVPEWVDPLLQRFYPSRYRIVWSEDAQELFFGSMIPKYGVGRNRWILEKWQPPPPRAEWTPMFEEALGPYPNQGTWEHSFTFEVPMNDERAYIPLRFDLVELVIRAIEAGRLQHTDAERKAAIKAREDEIERRWKKKFDDLWDDCKPAPGAKIPTHIKQLDSFGPVPANAMPPELNRRGLTQLPGGIKE